MAPSMNLYQCDCLLMSLSYSPEKNFSSARIVGHPTTSGFLESFKIRYNYPTKYSIVDISEVQFGASFKPDLSGAIEALTYSKALDPEFIEIKQGSKTAVIVSDSIQEAAAVAVKQMYDASDQKGIPGVMKVFRSEPEAMRWLFDQKQGPILLSGPTP